MVWLNGLGAIMVCIGLITALIDTGMNGSLYADWAPWGLLMAGVGCILVAV